MQIAARAVIEPIYLNASRDFSKWHSHNWHRLHAYFVQCGGSLDDSAEYVEFAKCQFDRQQYSQRDEDHLHEVEEENRRAQIDNDRYFANTRA